MAEDWEDWTALLKSGLSLFANVTLASQQKPTGKVSITDTSSAYASRAAKDLFEIGERVYKLSQKQMAKPQSTAISAPRNILNLTGQWLPRVEKMNRYIEIRHDLHLGMISIYAPKRSGVGYNEYFGGANNSMIFVSGNNSAGSRVIMKGVVVTDGSAIGLEVYIEGEGTYMEVYDRV
jgi:hypothetical protein